MGTIVLSPQDCFSSLSNRQSYYFPSATMPGTSAVRSQAVVLPLPVAEDCARHDFSGGSPPGDGLLPIPQPHGQARALSKKPIFPPKPSSIFCTPLAGRTHASAASSSPTTKRLSRSASAILPTPLVGSPPGVEGDGLHLLKGRLPFKVVQENGPGISKADAGQRYNTKKPNESRKGLPKKTSATNVASNVKIKGGLQGPRPTSKHLSDGLFMKGQPKKVDEKIDRRLERSHSVKGLRQKGDQNGGMPVVTILQRPQSKEAAAELLTKFFQESVEQEVLCVDEQPVSYIAEDLHHHPERIAESEIKQIQSRGVLSDSEICKDRPSMISSPCRTTGVLDVVTSEHLQGSPEDDAVKLAVLPNLETASDALSLFSSMGTPMGDVCKELASWERWAGPCYINSPPPSALPLPRFSRRGLGIESVAKPVLFEEVVPEKASSPPYSFSSLYSCLSNWHQVGGLNSDAVVTATKDLKRILNLDLCRM